MKKLSNSSKLERLWTNFYAFIERNKKFRINHCVAIINTLFLTSNYKGQRKKSQKGFGKTTLRRRISI